MEQKPPDELLHKEVTLKDLFDAGHIKPAFDPTGKNPRLLIAKSANQWLQEANLEPIPQQLFDVLWFEGELCVLFAGTNAGKSIIAMQIGDSISKGKAIPGFKLEASAQPVLYFDFELNKKQFEIRYSVACTQHYDFDPNFIRVEVSPNMVLPDGCTFEERLIFEIEQNIIEYNAKVLIIDNLTYLKTDWEKGKEALALMKQLKNLKTRYGLSILALAHTPKRDPGLPILITDIKGSSDISNFCDSAFALGKSCHGKNHRYLKQVKQRNTEQVYGDENVCSGIIEQPTNFLNIRFTGNSTEDFHLQKTDINDKTIMEENVMELHKLGHSMRQIGQQLNISHSKVERIIKRNKTTV